MNPKKNGLKYVYQHVCQHISEYRRNICIKDYLIFLILVYLILNLYVSFFQTKILIIGDWPHDIFKSFYGYFDIAFAWSPSIGILELEKIDNNNNFDVVIIDISPSDINSSKRNIDIINKLSKNSKIYWITNNVKHARLIKEEYNLSLDIMNRNIKNINIIINNG